MLADAREDYLFTVLCFESGIVVWRGCMYLKCYFVEGQQPNIDM